MNENNKFPAEDENVDEQREDYEGYADTEEYEEYQEYEEYEEYADEDEENEEPENLAEIAERILGARHAKASTAAPIRYRGENNEHQPSGHTALLPNIPKTKVDPKAQTARMGTVPRRTDDPTKKETARKKKQKQLTAIVAAIAVVLVAGVSIFVGVSAANRKNKAQTPDDIAVHTVEGSNPGDEPGLGAETVDPDEVNGVIPEDETDPLESETETTESESEKEGDAVTAENPENSEANPDGGTIPDDDWPEDDGGWQETEPPEPEVEKIWIAVNFYDRENITVYTEPTTLGQILIDNGTSLQPGETPSIGEWDWITESMTITVDKYEYLSEDVRQYVQHPVEEIQIDTIPRGDVNMLQEGKDGESIMHYTVAYKNGVEFDRKLEWEEVVTAAVAERYEIGIGGTLVGKDGVTYSYSYHRTVPATYYGITGLTYAGTYAGSNTVATDFNYIPLGTRLYIKNDRYDFGARTVEDTGERFDPWQVDIWMDANDSNYPLMSREGYVRDMEIYFLD